MHKYRSSLINLITDKQFSKWMAMRTNYFMEYLPRGFLDIVRQRRRQRDPSCLSFDALKQWKLFWFPV